MCAFFGFYLFFIFLIFKKNQHIIFLTFPQDSLILPFFEEKVKFWGSKILVKKKHVFFTLPIFLCPSSSHHKRQLMNLTQLEKLKVYGWLFSSPCGGLQPLAATVGPFGPSVVIFWREKLLAKKKKMWNFFLAVNNFWPQKISAKYFFLAVGRW